MLALMLNLAMSLADCVPACPLSEGVEQIRLGVGTQKVLTLNSEWRGYTFTGDGIEVKAIGNNQLLLIGARSGVTELRLFLAGGEKRYSLWVRKLDPDSCGSFGPGPYVWMPCGGDFDVSFRNDRLVATGTYRDLDDWKKVHAFRVAYRGAAIPPPTAPLLARALSDANVALFRAGLEVRVRRLGKGVVLTPADPATLKKAEEVLAPHRQLLVDLFSLALTEPAE
ncbi:MAG: hypothetical protein H6Q89_1288 [Myxococcaceae bacterium]|nr:hypothetical protein [Myxococcaceae bacterium]